MQFKSLTVLNTVRDHVVEASMVIRRRVTGIRAASDTVTHGTWIVIAVAVGVLSIGALAIPGSPIHHWATCNLDNISDISGTKTSLPSCAGAPSTVKSNPVPAQYTVTNPGDTIAFLGLTANNVSTVNLFDTATNLWTELPPVPNKGVNFGTIGYGLNGTLAFGANGLNILDVWNPNQCTATTCSQTTAPIPVTGPGYSIYYVSSVTVSPTGQVAVDYLESDSSTSTAHGENAIWTPSSNTWQLLPPVGNEIYWSYLGFSFTGTLTDYSPYTHALYDWSSSSNQWASLTLPNNLHPQWFAWGAHGNLAVVTPDPTSTISDEAVVYQPATKTWSTPVGTPGLVSNQPQWTSSSIFQAPMANSTDTQFTQMADDWQQNTAFTYGVRTVSWYYSTVNGLLFGMPSGDTWESPLEYNAPDNSWGALSGGSIDWTSSNGWKAATVSTVN